MSDKEENNKSEEENSEEEERSKNRDEDFKEILNMDPEDNTNLIKTNLLAGHRTNCSVCTHPGSYEAALVYFNTGRDLSAVKNFFLQKYDREFETKKLENHFRNHVDPYVDQITVTRQQRIEILRRRMRQRENTANNVAMIKEIILDFIQDVWVHKPNQLVSHEDYVKHKTLSKQMTDLAKVYKEYYSMELDLLGHGKSKEELEQQMRNFLMNSIKKVLNLIEDSPEAHRKISEYYGLVSDYPDDDDKQIEGE